MLSLQADLEETRKEKGLLASELNEVREKYREKLASLLIHDGDSAYHHSHAKVHHRTNSRKGTKLGPGLLAGLSHALSGAKGNNEAEKEEQDAAAAAEQAQPSGALTAAAQLQHQLLDSYSEREAVQGEALDRALQQNVAVKLAYRELYDKYRATMDVVEEQLPKASTGKMKPLEEQMKFAEIDVRASIAAYRCCTCAFHS
jgi:hypothetical protein